MASIASTSPPVATVAPLPPRSLAAKPGITRGPTLVLWDEGSLDSDGSCERVFSRTPGAESVMYPGRGHILMAEVPERVIPDLLAFSGLGSALRAAG